jgi:DNA-binding transcriptional ArsR family regulator
VDTYAITAIEALADPTRRKLFETLGAGSRSVSDLADAVPVSRPAVSQHLRVLERARLVMVRAEGRRRMYALDPRGIGAARDYLDGFWPAAISAYARAVASAPVTG